ncbi:UNKNOWN [Stylonychia lemnae]|uniref:Uncharacterized protein n=1 Tax=Stylonychia lemnae TaxID=5949 RepID=A0A077ZSL5_STYLE|nr:UNKNOWN [Stylonychia lemnae]|eukprot:CDW72873.1 UNKNOWN [Stylonychia lemnae]
MISNQFKVDNQRFDDDDDQIKQRYLKMKGIGTYYQKWQLNAYVHIMQQQVKEVNQKEADLSMLDSFDLSVASKNFSAEDLLNQYRSQTENDDRKILRCWTCSNEIGVQIEIKDEFGIPENQIFLDKKQCKIIRLKISDLNEFNYSNLKQANPQMNLENNDYNISLEDQAFKEFSGMLELRQEIINKGEQRENRIKQIEKNFNDRKQCK